MAKQTFTTGQVLTAAQMTSLQQTAMGGGSTTAKTASYTLVAADAGTTVAMSSASATTITVNTSLFSAGDTVYIQNLGAGVCTITAGTATVNTSASLALAQYEGGQLYFTSASASIFLKGAGGAAGGGKVLQVVSATYSTSTAITSTSLVDTGLSATITPTLATSKVLVLISQSNILDRPTIGSYGEYDLKRGATSIRNFISIPLLFAEPSSTFSSITLGHIMNLSHLDSPATTSATTYKTQASVINAAITSTFQNGSNPSSIILMEIGA